MQITKRGGFSPFESPNGREIYYAKGRDRPGLWSVPIGGGKEVKLLDFPAAGYWGYWGITRRGIYIMEFTTLQVNPLKVSQEAVIKHWSFAHNTLSTVVRLEKARTALYPGLAVSPDDRWVLYPQLDHTSSNLMLLEHFS